MRALSYFLGTVLTLTALSCTSTPDRQAGGRAFGDSYLSRELDSGNPSPIDRSSSYHSWRESE